MLIRTTNRFPSLWREFDELFRTAPLPTTPSSTTAPATDVLETDNAIEFKVDLPGVSPEGIDVKIEGNVLTLTAERKTETQEKTDGWIRQERQWGVFARSFVLPETVEGSEPEAAYKQGVLTVTLPKKEIAKPKTFKVKVEA
jgi:HSP20 family protein